MIEMSQQYSYLTRYLNRISGSNPEMVTASAYANGSATGFGQSTTAFEEQYRRKRIEASAVSWYNPVDENVYLTNTNDGEPHFDFKVFNVPSWKSGRRLLRTANADLGSVSKTDVDRAIYDAYEPEWQSQVQQFYDYVNMKTAGAITSEDFQGITTSIVQGELLDLDRRGYTLDQGVTTLRTEELEFEVDSYSRFQVAEDVGELELTPERTGQVTTQQFEVKRDQGHMAWTLQFQQRTRRHDIIQVMARNLAEDFDRVINERISTVLQTLTSIGATGAWDAIDPTHGNSDFDPTSDIIGVATIIRNSGGRADKIASNNEAYQAYVKNTFVKGVNAPNSNVTAGEAIYNNVPTLSGFTWYVDETLPNTKAFVYDVNGVLHIVGPRRVANYSKPEHELQGIVINNFDNTVIRTDGFGRQITGVTT